MKYYIQIQMLLSIAIYILFGISIQDGSPGTIIFTGVLSLWAYTFDWQQISKITKK